MSPDHITDGAYNRNIDKRLARNMVWLRETIGNAALSPYPVSGYCKKEKQTRNVHRIGSACLTRYRNTATVPRLLKDGLSVGVRRCGILVTAPKCLKAPNNRNLNASFFNTTTVIFLIIELLFQKQPIKIQYVLIYL